MHGVGTLLGSEVDLFGNEVSHLLVAAWVCSVTRVERHHEFANVCRSLVSGESQVLQICIPEELRPRWLCPSRSCVL